MNYFENQKVNYVFILTGEVEYWRDSISRLLERGRIVIT